jgi:hypothetical protein
MENICDYENEILMFPTGGHFLTSWVVVSFSRITA